MGNSFFTFAPDVAPVCEIGISATRQAEPSSWLDVSCHVHEVELFRGRERFNERFEPGTASVTFSNDDGWADLGGTYADVAAAELRPGRQIRIGVRGAWTPGLAPFVRWLYRGFIDQATPAYDPVLHDVVTVNCIDALGEAGQTTAPTGDHQGVNETVSQRLNRVLDAVGWFGTKRKIDATATTVQGTSLGSAAVDLMGQAADSAGGVVFGDLDGDVVFRDIDWMLYDPDTPPDGTIGPGPPGTPPGDLPPYIDPTPGPVYDPDDPPAEHPPKVCVCADGTAGTLIEKGDNYRLYVRDGHLFYESSGHTWDMGPYSGGCTCVDPNGPERTDGPDYEISPFPPVELPPQFAVELLAWSDGGLSDPPVAAVTVAGIAPGHDCLLVVLVNALGTATNTTGLVPAFDGGGLDWAHRRDADMAADGASSFIALAPVGRDDPGSFDVTVTWTAPSTSRSHIVTVWKVTAQANDYLARFDAGLVLYAATDSSVDEGEPGNGPNLVPLVADRQPRDVEVRTRTVDITIAQSLAEEDTAPFGAILAETDGPWNYPPNTPPQPAVGALVAGYTDDFERADGPLGADWAAPDPYPVDSIVFTSCVPGSPTISGGAAVAASAGVDAIAVYTTPVPGDHYIEVEIDDWDTGVSCQVGVFTRLQDDGFTCQSAIFNQSGTSGGAVYCQGWGNGVHFAPTLPFIDLASGSSFVLRLESTVAGHHRVYADGVLIDEQDDPTSATGDGVGIWIRHASTAGPRINWVAIGSGAVRKASWVAGWRVGVASEHVSIDDVNTGPSDIQSAQACLVVESPEPEGGWRILDADLRADLTGVTPAGSITLDNAPRPGALAVVFVGVTASTDVLDAVTVTGADFTRSFVQTKSGSSWGQGAVFVAVAPLDYDPASWAVQVNYPEVGSISAVAYEVAVQDDEAPVGVHAANVLGTNTAGSVNGPSTITLTGAGDAAAVVLAYIHVSADAASDSGATPFEGEEWREEYQSPPTGKRAYFQTMSRAPGQPESTSTAVVWADVQTGTAATYSGVQLAIEIHPFDGLPATGSADPVALGGVTDPWNGTIDAAWALDPVSGAPIWMFP